MSAPTELEIRAVAHGGEGVGVATGTPVDGRTWFVAGALAGERVVAELESEHKRYLRGRLLRVVTAAPERVQAPCVHAGTCGGCGLMHVAAAGQLELKRRIAADQLRRPLSRAGIELVAEDVGGSALGYRRRARVHYRRVGAELVLGFCAARSRTIVDHRSCPVLAPELDRALQRLRTAVDWLPETGEAHGIAADGKVVLGLSGVVPTADALGHFRDLLDETLVGIHLRGGRQRAVVGTAILPIDGDAGLPAVAGHPFTFSQASAPGNRRLVERVTARARAQGVEVLELFAGSGNFTRALARTATGVWAVEQDREAIEALRGLVGREGLPVHVRRGSAEATLARARTRGNRWEVVVLDPPRTGLGAAGCEALAEVVGRRVVYVSCDPATLARDLEVLTARGLEWVDAVAVDLMRMTPEVEIVATLERKR